MVHALEVLPLCCSFPHNPPKDTIKRTIDCVKLTRQIYCNASTHSNQSTSNRRSANYQPSSWNLDFLESIGNSQEGESQKETSTKLLKEEVRSMLENTNLEPTEVLELVDDIDRLGLGYQFRKSIKRALDKIRSQEEATIKVKKSLHASALYFRLLRQNGYTISTAIPLSLDYPARYPTTPQVLQYLPHANCPPFFPQIEHHPAAATTPHYLPNHPSKQKNFVFVVSLLHSQLAPWNVDHPSPLGPYFKVEGSYYPPFYADSLCSKLNGAHYVP